MLLFSFGLFGHRYAEFEAPGDAPREPVVTFVGTFDPRKGMNELPGIVAAVARRHPGVRFRLLGTAGLVPDVAGVVRHFRTPERERLEVIPRFEPAELPKLLRGASLGIFPSRCEGFPFGVLEQLAAGLPVLAYRVPGAPELLPPELLVERGDGAGLARLTADLLDDTARLIGLRGWARRRALDFRWEDVAKRTAEEYARRLVELRNRRS
jgi:glycosyltransferase involved in cell wall biosynthesis